MSETKDRFRLVQTVARHCPQYSGDIEDAARALALAAAQRVIDYDTDHEPDYGQADDGRAYCCSYHRLEWELRELGR